MIAFASFLFSPIGRWIGGVALLALVAGGIYLKGYSDGKANVTAKWQAAERAMAERGRGARQQAEAEIPPLAEPDPGSPLRPCRVPDPNDRDCH